MDDLFAEMKAGKRTHVGSPEMDWARNYERSLIPPDMRFPVKGDVYEALEDVEVRYLTTWAAPFTGGGKGILQKGERVFVNHESTDPKPIGVNVMAVDYALLECRLVPEAERKAPKYSGFHLSLKTVALNTKLKLVETGFVSPGAKVTRSVPVKGYGV